MGCSACCSAGAAGGPCDERPASFRGARGARRAEGRPVSALLEVESLSKKFGGLTALSDLGAQLRSAGYAVLDAASLNRSTDVAPQQLQAWQVRWACNQRISR